MLLQTTLDSLRKLPITRFETDSRKITPGTIFVCAQGLHHDSHDFIEDAVNRGAVGLIAQRQVNASLPCFVMPGQAMATSLISQYYNYPQRQLFNIGVTGTNGKTTVAYCLYQLLEQLDSAAYTGTLGCEFKNFEGNLINTTPDAITLLNLMNQMVDANVGNHVMEVSSHALDQNRVSCIDYDTVIFTNIGEDHLDYHGSRDEYLQAKLRLADRLKPRGTSIINLDDPVAMAVIDRCQLRGNILTFSAKDECADVYASHIHSTCQGSQFLVRYQSQEHSVSIPLPFHFNVENTLAVIATLLAKGFTTEQFLPLLKTIPAVPGRCEIIPLKNGATVMVDYAHNLDALGNLIRHVRQLTNGKVHTLMGVTGDRLMDAESLGRYCSEWSDHSYFTADNPMGLNVETIISAMSASASPDKITSENSRERAIALALNKLAEKKHSDDVLLVCGKGPETWQYTSADKQKSEPYSGDKNVITAYAHAAGLLKNN